MNVPPGFPDQKRRWFQLGLRHLRAASSLADAGLADAATFHAVHAYECIISAVIAWRGYPVPSDGQVTKGPHPGPKGPIPSKQSTHVCKRLLFEDCADQSAAYYATQMTLVTFVTNQLRNDALYYKPLPDKLPHQAFNNSYARGLTARIRQFAGEVWREIR